MHATTRDFLYPYAPYHGSMQPDQFIFNANLQEFAQRITYISNLHTGGKLSSDEAFDRIHQLWCELQQNQIDRPEADEPQS